MNVTFDFTGKVALVTGAGSGMGRTSALAFAAAGAEVAVADIDAVGGQETVDLIAKTGGRAQYFAVDVADPERVRQLVADVVAAYGRLDFAHNNAGIEGEHAPLLAQSDDNWRRVIDVNLASIFYCLKAEIPAMLESGGGAIVNTASASGLIGGYWLATYTASKHGVIGLTKAAATEFGAQGIRVNAVCPGPVDTPFIAALPDVVKDRMLSGTPIGRLGQPEEIAQTVLWLCSDGASYVIGEALSADGGVVIGGTATRVDDLFS
ncbi:glucose 1-dehydrogenase [Streptomyces sp. NPDC057257]|uniref:glucose 1-dehydrogenase n=1 Tax=Streptomyces sp. NPDC057257 TaxID=3346071 RepID=UPI00363D97E7